MGCYSIAWLPPAFNSPIPIYTPGWRETLWGWSVLPMNITHFPRLGLEPGPLDPESSALTMRPPRLSQERPVTNLLTKHGRKGRNCVIIILLLTLITRLDPNAVKFKLTAYSMVALLSFYPFSEQHLITPHLCLLRSSCLPGISNIEYRKSASQRPGAYFKFRTMRVRELCSGESLFFNMS